MPIDHRYSPLRYIHNLEDGFLLTSEQRQRFSEMVARMHPTNTFNPFISMDEDSPFTFELVSNEGDDNRQKHPKLEFMKTPEVDIKQLMQLI